MGLWTRPADMWSEYVASAAQARFVYIASDLDELDGKPRFALIEEIARAMQSNFDEMTHYYHIPSGEVICVQDCHIKTADGCGEDETFDEAVGWEREPLRQALHLLWHEDEYLQIPAPSRHEEY